VPRPKAGDAARYLHIVKNPQRDEAPLVFVRDGLSIRNLEIPAAARASLIQSLNDATELQEVNFAYGRKSSPSYIKSNRVREKLRFIDLGKHKSVVAILRALTVGYKAPSTWRWRDDPNGPPRRVWNEKFTAVYPQGVSVEWKDRHAEHVFINRLEVLSYGVPREVLEEGLPDGWGGAFLKAVLILVGHRVGGKCPRKAGVVLRDRYASHIGLVQPPGSKLPVDEQNGKRLVHELLNGMAPVYLRPVPNTSDEYTAHSDFTDLSFSDPLGRSDTLYKLPNVVTHIKVGADNRAYVDRIRLQYRDENSPDYNRGGASAYGDWTEVSMYPATDDWRQSAARRIALGVGLLAGQLDGHIAMGHIAMEAMAVAFNKVTWPTNHPVADILAPRLDEVDAVNRNADDNIWGTRGLFPVVSAIDEAGLKQRRLERAQAVDWLNWKPRSKSIAKNHYAPKVLSRYYSDAVVPYIEHALGWDAATQSFPWFVEGHPHYAPMMAFFEEIANVPLSHRPWDDEPLAVWHDPIEFCQKASGPAFSRGSTSKHVHHLTAFIVHNATLGHSWPNVRQNQLGGDPDFGSPSLRLRIDEGPQTLKWHSLAAPLPCDALYLLLIVDVLTFLNVDTLDKEWSDENDEVSSVGPLSKTCKRDPFARKQTAGGLDASLAGRFNRIRMALDELSQDADYPDPLIADAVQHLSRCNR
jgi:hypothetical protein